MSWTVPLREGPASPWIDRAVAVLAVAAAIAALVLLLPIEPDPRGYGTHEQLGMTPCSWPFVYGIPCPTCGCTTAATLLLHGRPLAAAAAQPFGAAACLSLLASAAFCLFALVRGRSVLDVVARLPFWRITLFGLLLLLGSWGYKCLLFRAP
ncbi:MAG: hypothetical protein Fur0037_01240 [Planctomycetota bacterium]